MVKIAAMTPDGSPFGPLVVGVTLVLFLGVPIGWFLLFIHWLVNHVSWRRRVAHARTLSDGRLRPARAGQGSWMSPGICTALPSGFHVCTLRSGTGRGVTRRCRSGWNLPLQRRAPRSLTGYSWLVRKVRAKGQVWLARSGLAAGAGLVPAGLGIGAFTGA